MREETALSGSDIVSLAREGARGQPCGTPPGKMGTAAMESATKQRGQRGGEEGESEEQGWARRSSPGRRSPRGGSPSSGSEPIAAKGRRAKLISLSLSKDLGRRETWTQGAVLELLKEGVGERLGEGGACPDGGPVLVALKSSAEAIILLKGPLEDLLM